MSPKRNPRRIRVHDDDILVVNGFDIQGDVVKAIVDPKPRVLWSFQKSEDGNRIIGVAHSEDHVIWMDRKKD